MTEEAGQFLNKGQGKVGEVMSVLYGCFFSTKEDGERIYAVFGGGLHGFHQMQELEQMARKGVPMTAGFLRKKETFISNKNQNHRSVDEYEDEVWDKVMCDVMVGRVRPFPRERAYMK